MKYQIFFIFVFLIAIEEIANADSSCKGNSDKCNDSLSCCSRYCSLGECVPYGQYPGETGSKNPCDDKNCPDGQQCAILQLPMWNKGDNQVNSPILGPGKAYCIDE